MQMGCTRMAFENAEETKINNFDFVLISLTLLKTSKFCWGGESVLISTIDSMKTLYDCATMHGQADTKYSEDVMIHLQSNVCKQFTF
jgi:hypothetical protein